jgi:hypothetical protein
MEELKTSSISAAHCVDRAGVHELEEGIGAIKGSTTMAEVLS